MNIITKWEKDFEKIAALENSRDKLNINARMRTIENLKDAFWRFLMTPPHSQISKM